MSVNEGNERANVVSLYLQKDLVAAVRRDLKELDKICGEVFSWFGGELFQYQPGAFLTDMTFGDDGCFETLDEAYNKFRIFLSLLVRYLNCVPSVMEAFKSSGFVEILKEPSLAMVATMLWERMQVLYKLILPRALTTDYCSTIKVESVPTISQSSQTQLSTVEICSSCQHSQEMVKKIIIVFETLAKACHVTNSTVNNTREIMRKEVFNLSQWGAMVKWCNAILHDSKKIGEKIVLIREKNRTRLQRAKKVRSKLMKLKGQLKEKKVYWERKIRLAQARCKKGHKIQNALKKSLVEFRSVLEKTKRKLEEAEAKAITYEAKINSLEHKLSETESECTIQKKKSEEHKLMADKNLARYVELVESSKKQEAILLHKVNDQYDLIKEKDEQIEKSSNDILVLNEKMKSLSEREAQLKKKIEDEVCLRDEIDILNTTIKRNEETINKQNEKIVKLVLISKSKLAVDQEINKQIQTKVEGDPVTEELQLMTDKHPPIKVEGDPIKDMESQVKANKQQIQYLITQNVQLNKTLRKLHMFNKKKREKMGAKGKQETGISDNESNY